MYQVVIKGPDGDAIELVASADRSVCEGAKLGAQALLNLLSDDLELEEGYEIVMRQEDAADFSPPFEERLS